MRKDKNHLPKSNKQRAGKYRTADKKQTPGGLELKLANDTEEWYIG